MDNACETGRSDALARLEARLSEIEGNAGVLDARELARAFRDCMDDFAREVWLARAPYGRAVGIVVEGARSYALASFGAWLDMDPGDPVADEILCAHDAGIARAIAVVAAMACSGYAPTDDERASVERLAQSIDDINRYPMVKADLAKAIDEVPFDIIDDTPRVAFDSTDALLREGGADEIRDAAIQVVAMSGRHALAHVLLEAALERRPEDAVAGLYATLLERVREVVTVASASRLPDVAQALERLLSQGAGEDASARWQELTRFGSYAAHLLGEVEGHLRDVLGSDRLHAPYAARVMAQLADAEATGTRLSVQVAHGLAEAMRQGPVFSNYLEYRAWKHCLERVPNDLRDDTWRWLWHELRQRFARQVREAKDEADTLLARVEELERSVERAKAMGVSARERQAMEGELVSAQIALLYAAAPFDVSDWEELG